MPTGCVKKGGMVSGGYVMPPLSPVLDGWSTSEQSRSKDHKNLNFRFLGYSSRASPSTWPRR